MTNAAHRAVPSPLLMDLTQMPLDRPFTYSEAMAAGGNSRTLAAMMRCRQLRRVLRGVYADSALPDTLPNRLAALKLVVPPRVVIRKRTASWLHGVDCFSYTELYELPPIETCVPPQNNRVRRREVVSARIELAPADVMELDGLAVTTPLRTAIDLGRELHRPLALGVLDSFVRLGHFDVTALSSEARKFAGHRGVVQLRTLSSLVNPAAESTGESWIRWALIAAGLPEPVVQLSIVVDGRELYRLDLAYPGRRVAVEYDGEDFHTSARQRAYDERRRAWLREHGWVVIVVRKSDLTRERIERWTADVRRAVHSQAA